MKINELKDMCKVCGQTPCNCTHVVAEAASPAQQAGKKPKSEGVAEGLTEGPYLPDGPAGVRSGIGGTAKYGMGLGDKRNMLAKNPEIQNDLQGFKSWLNGGPKPADINDMLTGVDTYFTNIEVPSDARVATALQQVLKTKTATPQQVQILNPAVDVAIKAPIRNSASGQQDYLHPNQAPQQAQTQTVAVPVPVPGQAQQPQQAAQQPAATAATARAAGKKFDTSNATTVTPRPVARPALPMARLREQGVAEGLDNTDDILQDLTSAYRTCVKHRDSYTNFGNIQTVYELLRDPLMKGDIAGYEKMHGYVAGKYPDAFDALMDEVSGEQGVAEGIFGSKENSAVPLVNKIAQVARQLTPQNVNVGKQIIQSNADDILRMMSPQAKTGIEVIEQGVAEARESCPECGGPMFPALILGEKQDACYYKVKSRYKVWPSAYASGALVQCRKKGAANWGNKSK